MSLEPTKTVVPGARRKPKGFGSVDRWVQAYVDEEKSFFVAFNELMDRWLQHLRHPEERLSPIEEIIDAIDYNAPGNTCAICLEKLEISLALNNSVSMVACKQCHQEIHAYCLGGMEALRGKYTCPLCRKANKHQKHPARDEKGLLMHLKRPGYKKND